MVIRLKSATSSAIKNDEMGVADTTDKGVYVLALSVENVRCFGPIQTLDLSSAQGGPSRWTVILGDNGTGKTTLLECIASQRAIETHTFDRDDVIVMTGSPWHPSISAARWFLRAGSDNNARVVSTLSFQEKLESSNNDDDTLSVELGEFTGSGEPRRYSFFYSEQWLLKARYYGYGANRHMRATSLSEDTLDDPTISLFLDSGELRNAEEWLLQADYAASKTSKVQADAKKRLKAIKALLIDLLPDVESIRFTEPNEAGETPSVEFRTPYGWVPLRRLGLGYKTLIAWMVDFASRLFERDPDNPSPLDQPAVCLVDEIDLHLHPRWQRQVMNDLSRHFPNTQFIVTAHSPLFVQSAAGKANIAVLRREGDHVIIDQSVKGVQGWRVDQVLTSDLFDLDTARSIEFEELMDERQQILLKSRPNSKDKLRLAKIEEELARVPLGETPSDRESWELIREAAEAYRKERHKT